MVATSRPAVLDHPAVASAWSAVEAALVRYERAIGQALAGDDPTLLVDAMIFEAELEPGDDLVDYVHLAVPRGSVGNPAGLKGKTMKIRDR